MFLHSAGHSGDKGLPFLDLANYNQHRDTGGKVEVAYVEYAVHQSLLCQQVNRLSDYGEHCGPIVIPDSPRNPLQCQVYQIEQGDQLLFPNCTIAVDVLWCRYQRCNPVILKLLRMNIAKHISSSVECHRGHSMSHTLLVIDALCEKIHQDCAHT